MLTLRWTVPSNDGGCPILGYNLFRDDGEQGGIVTEVDASAINGKPSLLQHQIIFLASETGKQFRFQIQTSNVQGSVISSVASYVLATVPNQPSDIPSKVLKGSNSTSLRIKVQPFTDAQTGGDPILGYQIELDDGQAGEYQVVLGENTEDPEFNNLETLATVLNLTPKSIYRARYRAFNSIGFG
jgi:hypothetical protein